MTQLVSLSGFDFIFSPNMLLVKSLPSASDGLVCPAQGPTPPTTYTLVQEGKYQRRYSHRVCPEDHRSCKVGAWATWMGRVYFLEEVLFYLLQVLGKKRHGDMKYHVLWVSHNCCSAVGIQREREGV